jgi:hypothetical protein
MPFLNTGRILSGASLQSLTLVRTRCDLWQRCPMLVQTTPQKYLALQHYAASYAEIAYNFGMLC